VRQQMIEQSTPSWRCLHIDNKVRINCKVLRKTTSKVLRKTRDHELRTPIMANNLESEPHTIVTLLQHLPWHAVGQKDM